MLLHIQNLERTDILSLRPIILLAFTDAYGARLLPLKKLYTVQSLVLVLGCEIVKIKFVYSRKMQCCFGILTMHGYCHSHDTRKFYLPINSFYKWYHGYHLFSVSIVFLPRFLESVSHLCIFRMVN